MAAVTNDALFVNVLVRIGFNVIPADEIIARGCLP